MLPSGFPEVANYPNVARLLDVQVDMQFVDLATLLQLPQEGLALRGGCNLTATLLACSIISGVSVLFFEASIDAVRGKDNALRSGKRFKRLVRDYFPWEGDEAVAPAEAATLLYEHTRNPLTHALGVGKAGVTFPGLGGDTILLSKGALPDQWVAHLMRGEPTRPEFLRRTITRDGDAYTLDVGALAWGVCRMLRRLLADDGQVRRAEALATELRGTV
jgi:hypothetical protein